MKVNHIFISQFCIFYMNTFVLYTLYARDVPMLAIFGYMTGVYLLGFYYTFLPDSTSYSRNSRMVAVSESVKRIIIPRKLSKF